MKYRFNVYILGILTLMFIAGCATTQELKSSITSKVSSITSTVDPALVNQVPADKKEGFSRAEFDLDVADQKLKLAELRSELAGTQKKYANYEEDLASKLKKEAEAEYDLVKITAIANSGLGKKEDNTKTRANLQSRKLELQADMIKIKANMESAKDKITELTAEAAKMDEAIKAIKFDDARPPAPAEKGNAAPATDKAPEPKK
jgi:multidrug resistance efflux pump